MNTKTDGSGPFQIRLATIADAGVVARQRAAMFVDIGSLTPDAVDDLVERTTALLREAIPRGEYIGWLASPVSEPHRLIAGAGVQIRRILPFPRLGSEGRTHIGDGRQAIVLNVYTEAACRRRGIARALMLEVMEWARDTKVESLVLHAAPDGRPLYEALGFVATNEMRFAGDLVTWKRPADG